MADRGFTLVEVMIALVILMGGVMASVKATGAAVGLTARSARLGRIARVAEQELETLPLNGCLNATGRRVEDVLDITWSTSVSGNIGDIRVLVHWPSKTGMRVDTFVTAFLCP
jgi:prepilin-type N-terminal cleavage/methylation domain-containing protein